MAQLQVVGPPFARYWKVPRTAAAFEVEAGFPVDGPLPSEAHDEVQPSRLPDSTAAAVLHVGPRDVLSMAYEVLQKWVTERGGTPRRTGLGVLPQRAGGRPGHLAHRS